MELALLKLINCIGVLPIQMIQYAHQLQHRFYLLLQELKHFHARKDIVVQSRKPNNTLKALDQLEDGQPQAILAKLLLQQKPKRYLAQ